MKYFSVSEELLNQILLILQELPAKTVLVQINEILNIKQSGSALKKEPEKQK